MTASTAEIIEMHIDFEYFEREKPSYIPAYIMSAFLLGGISTLVANPIPFWPISFVHVFLAIWFGMFFFWASKYAKQQHMLVSHRIQINREGVVQTFRYAITEQEFTRIEAGDIYKIEVQEGSSPCIWFFGKSDVILYSFKTLTEYESLKTSLGDLFPGVEISTKRG